MFQRRILHHGADPSSPGVPLQDRAVAGCWFELHRQGGCGAGEVVLRDEFLQREGIEVGDWLSCEAAAGERWYLGRVEERRAASPAEVRLRLEGMSIELGEVFPGGFSRDADGVPPHRYAATDLFPHDPDHSLETLDSISTVDELVRRLLEQYVVPATHILHNPARIETPRRPAPVTSLKFRGEESVRAILKELALRGEASWGVDAAGEFFFLQSRWAPLTVWREGRDLTVLHETRDREHLFNRVLLTGDYVYDHLDTVENIAQRCYRWRGNYTQPESRSRYGERRIRLWIPWLRTESDSLAFVREFFRIYARPTSRYWIETAPQTSLPLPWNGRVRLEDRRGEVLTVGAIETIRVLFDHAPRFRLELGPSDPRDLWPEPPHDERWELPAGRSPGGPVDVTDLPPPLTLLSSAPSSAFSSDESSDASSDVSSDFSSAASWAETFLSTDEDVSASSGDSGPPSSSGSSASSAGDSSLDDHSSRESGFLSSSGGDGSTPGTSMADSSSDSSGGSSAGDSSLNRSSEFSSAGTASSSHGSDSSWESGSSLASGSSGAGSSSPPSDSSGSSHFDSASSSGASLSEGGGSSASTGGDDSTSDGGSSLDAGSSVGERSSSDGPVSDSAGSSSLLSNGAGASSLWSSGTSESL